MAAAGAATAMWAAAALSGCSDDDGRVELAFDPPVGAVFEYITEVTATTATDLPCDDAPPATEQTTLTTRQEVLEPDGDGVRLSVRLTRQGLGSRTLVVRLDRGAQLVAVESVEGVPTAALGDLGVAELLPAVAAAPPDRPLAPGEEWEIDQSVDLGEGETARVRGEGRLRRLGVVDGRDTATVASTTTVAVQTSTASPDGGRSLAGEQTSEVEAVFDLADGALQRASTRTIGDYRLLLTPPPGTEGNPCEGTLTVEVTSSVERSA
jgi:hypothetical protein